MNRWGKLIALSCCFLSGCSTAPRPVPPDHPRLTPNLVLRDVTFRSAALSRDMQYRVVLPALVAKQQRLPVVYLLHGGGGNFHDWTNYTDVASYAERGLILVMPQGDDSYYTNSASRPQDRYEDYIVGDLLRDVEAKFPVASDRAHRAIAGVSMGGFGAIKLSLRHPELFAFVGGLSSAIDVPSRPFSLKRIGQYRYHESIFGGWQSQTRQANDPFVLARSTDPKQTSYLFLTCGDQEGLLPANRSFARLLGERHFAYEFHQVSGGHNWEQWSAQLPAMFQVMRRVL